jgi:predicted phage terminase large subunit-like protein
MSLTLTERTALETRVLAKKLAELTPEQRHKIQRAVIPRLTKYIPHIPHPKQQVFLSLTTKEVGFGGAAGGGKSDALLMAALQYVDVPGYSALLLRRTWSDLALPGAIMDRARQWLQSTDAKSHDGGRYWTFPSGARITFGYLQYNRDKTRYQSAEFQFIGFDELTQFDTDMYTYMFSRMRKPAINCLNCRTNLRQYRSMTGVYYKHTTAEGKQYCKEPYPDQQVLGQYPPAPDGMTIFDLPLRMRSATNPGGIGHEWVRNRFIDERTRNEKAIFVPSLLSDNPSLDQASYREALEHLNPVDQERLLNGDWDVTEEGDYFQRHWFTALDMTPAGGKLVRFWDMAATEQKKDKKNDPDWTVGTLCRLLDGNLYIEDIVRFRRGPAEAERIIRHTAMMDGPDIPIRMEQEPGSSGVMAISHYRRNILVGFNFDGIRSTGDKKVRAQPLSSMAKAGNCYIKKATWNRAFLDEAALFPNGAHDDQVDATSGALKELAFGRKVRILA